MDGGRVEVSWNRGELFIFIGNRNVSFGRGPRFERLSGQQNECISIYGPQLVHSPGYLLHALGNPHSSNTYCGVFLGTRWSQERNE